jgi:hypothetical protein
LNCELTIAISLFGNLGGGVHSTSVLGLSGKSPAR